MKSTTNEALSAQIATVNTNQAVILSQMNDIKEDVKDIKGKLESSYATKEWCESQYGQTKKLVNGIVTVILLAVVGALLTLVIIK